MNTTATSEVRILTPNEANKFLEENKFRLQRKIRARHLSNLVLAMKGGEFPPGTAIYFAQTPESLELIDGQHRLRAQVNAGMNVEYTVTTISCPDAKAVACLYTQFDIGAKRSMVDRMKAIDVAAYSDLAPRQAQLLYTAAPYLKYRFGKLHSFQVTDMTPLQRLDLLREYDRGAKLFFASMEGVDTWIQKVFLRPSFVAFGSFVFQHAPEKAAYLWDAIATNTFDGASDPRYQMFNLAQNAEVKNLVGIKRSNLVIQAFIRGWNAVVEDRPMLTKLNLASIVADRVTILGVGDGMNPNENNQATLLDPAEDVKLESRNPEQVISDVMDQLSMAFPKEKPPTVRNAKT